MKAITTEKQYNTAVAGGMDAYVTVYEPIAGHKAVLITVDEDCKGNFTPWNTSYFAHRTREAAVADGLDWAYAENIPFVLCDPTEAEMVIIEAFEKVQKGEK